MVAKKLENIKFKKLLKVVFRKKESDLYKGCADLPMHNFSIVRETSDFRWLAVGFTGYSKVQLPDDVDKLFEDIMNEYCGLSQSTKSLDYYELIVDINKLETRYETVKALLLMLPPPTPKKTMKAIINELHEWKFKFDPTAPFKKEMHRMTRQLSSALTRINSKIEDLEKFQEDNDEEPASMMVNKIALERVLNKNRIDLKVVTVEEWVAIINEAKRVTKQIPKWQSIN